MTNEHFYDQMPKLAQFVIFTTIDILSRVFVGSLLKGTFFIFLNNRGDTLCLF